MLDYSVNTPPHVCPTRRSSDLLELAPIEAQLQVTVPADCEQLPLPTGVVAETNVELTGIVLVSTAFVGCEVLWILVCTKNCTSPLPSVIGSGETLMLVMPRSIW